MTLPKTQQQAAAAFGPITVPNILSLSRLALAPIVVALLLAETPTALLVAFLCMIVAEASDFFDGYLARSLRQESELGRLIDPVCDVVYHVCVFLAFVKLGWMAPWLLFMIYARDLSVPYIQALARQRGRDVGVRFSGKVKTAIHGGAQLTIVAVMLGLVPDWLAHGPATVDAALALALLASAASLVDYAVAAFAAPADRTESGR